MYVASAGGSREIRRSYGLLDHLHPWFAGWGIPAWGLGKPLEAVLVQQIQLRSVVKILSTGICRLIVGITLRDKGLAVTPG
jgi:hypothetical protein